MTENNIQERERERKVSILLLCVFVALCTAGLILCYAKERTSRIEYAAAEGMLPVIPGDSASVVNFGFTLELPRSLNRRYALVICDVAFEGGLTFADMNEGQWEYSLDGGPWLPLILSEGQCVLETDAAAGEKNLLLRAADNLDAGARGGNLSFRLKLKENPRRITLWILLGIITGAAFIAAAYPIIKPR